MPLVQIDLTDNETHRVDAVAEEQKRSRKAQCHVLIIERLDEIDREKAKIILEKGLENYEATDGD